MAERYLIALGSNIRHHVHGSPRSILGAALERLEQEGIAVELRSRVIETVPHGPSLRRYANAAAVVATSAGPMAMLTALKRIERAFGRRRGRRWGARVLDLDIVLWEGGAWSSPQLTVPHVAFRERPFVILPAAEIAGTWRDPLSSLTLRQLAGRRLAPRRYTL